MGVYAACCSALPFACSFTSILPRVALELGANGVRFGDERFGLRLVDAIQLGVQRHIQEKPVFVLVEVHGRGHLDVIGIQGDFLKARRRLNRAAEAGRISNCSGLVPGPFDPGGERLRLILPSGLVALPSRPAVALAVSDASTAMGSLLKIAFRSE
jgi:hypothetical protein